MKRNSRCCSPRSSSWDALAATARRAGRVRRSLARPGHRADRVGRAPARRRRAVRGPTRRAHPGRGRRPPRADGRAARRHTGAGRRRVHRRTRRVLGRQRQRPRPGRDRRHARRASPPASARAQELGVRRVTAAERRRRVPHPADGRRHRRAAARSWPRSTLAAPAAPVVSNHDAVAYADADGWRDRLARPRVGAGALALDHGHARRPRRHDVPRGRARLDARGARQARRARRSPSATSPLPKTSPRSWRSHSPWKPS